MRGKNIIEFVARKNNVSVQEVEEEMRKAIFISYLSSGASEEWIELFGEGHIPEPEEFISKMAGKIVA